MPRPATATPTGSSQIAPRRSDQSPKSGWITEDETAEASTIVAASVYERSKRSTRNGRSAGSAPFAKSVPRWPAARSVIARLSMPALTPPQGIDGLQVRSAASHRLGALAGRTQEALYAEIDLELSWSEAELPQVERTKHVHSIHPYLGKFIPQLAEVFLHRYFRPGDCVYDPFVGSGTTLVEANAFGAAAVGCDISAFNCLLARVKTTAYSLGALELALRGALEQARLTAEVVTLEDASTWLRDWYAEAALRELLAYHCASSELLDEPSWDVARIVLSRAARSARQTTHFDLDFPRRPVTRPYWCHKHKRTCRPVGEALKFLRRYTDDTVRRIREFA